jgi:GPH family glycoside/pentoside/hexuronide:cation symporter
MSTTPTPNPPPAKEGLRRSEYIGYALGDTASNLFFQTFGIFLTYFYTDVWGLAPAVVGTMFLIVRLVDAMADPLIGLMADRTETRWGKFRPYLLWFALPYGIGGYLLFASPSLAPDGTFVQLENSANWLFDKLPFLQWIFGQSEFSQGGKLAYAYLTYGFMMLMYSFINVPYSSMLGVISPSPRIRTLASSYRFVGAFGGGLLVSLFVRPLVKFLGGGANEAGKVINELRGFQLTMLIFAGISVLMFLICFATTKERVKVPPGQKSHAWGEVKELVRNYPWVMLLLSSIFSLTFIGLRNGSAIYYFKYVAKYDNQPVLFGLFDRVTVFISLGMACMMLGSYCLSFFARVADKRVLSFGLTFVTAACWAAFYLIPAQNFPLQLAVQALGTFCMGPASALVWAMYADVADYGEWKFGRRSTGLVYSASLFAIKTGTAVAGLMLPWILAKYDYLANVAQSTTSIVGITLTFSLFPAGVAVLKGVALWIYPLGKSKVDQIEQDLLARRAAANPTPSL